jgi:hypothetical protein
MDACDISHKLECTDQADKECEHGCVTPESEAIMY